MKNLSEEEKLYLLSKIENDIPNKAEKRRCSPKWKEIDDILENDDLVAKFAVMQQTEEEKRQIKRRA